MFPLAVVSAWMWLLIFKKLAELRGIDSGRLTLERSRAFLENPESAPDGWRGDLIREFSRDRVFDPEADRKTVEALVYRKSNRLGRHVRTIIVLASVAPLLGLLGTVTGMITTFDVISFFGTGNARAMAGGISEALISTQSGLVVAIPGYLMGSVLFRRIQKNQARMKRFGLDLCTACEFGDTLNSAE